MGTEKRRLRPFGVMLATVASAMVGIAAPAEAVPGISGTVGSPSGTASGATVTFSGTVVNTGNTAADNFSSVQMANDGSTGVSIVSLSPVGALAYNDSPAPFTVTAQITGLPGTSAQLRLKATGITPSALDADPQADIDGPAFIVTVAVKPAVADFDGDGDTDISVYRPGTGQWFVQGRSPVSFGTGGDIPVPADYDGNGTTDIAVFRPSVGGWYRSGGPTTFFGLSGDDPGTGRSQRRRALRHRRLPAIGRWVVPQRRTDDVLRTQR